MKLTLTKTLNYELKPFGKFVFLFGQSKKNDRANIIRVNDIDIKTSHFMTMPLSKDQEELFVKEMKKFKTDVFTDDEYFYTLTNSGLTVIDHPSFLKYKNIDSFRELIDNGKSF